MIQVLSATDKPSRFGSLYPKGEDKVYLAQALENIWFRDEAPTESFSSLVEDLDTRLEEVAQRSKGSNSFVIPGLKNWSGQKTTFHCLDPSEDVDDSNWFKTGHFRRQEGSVPEGAHTKRHRSTVDGNGDFVLEEWSESENYDKTEDYDRSSESSDDNDFSNDDEFSKRSNDGTDCGEE